MRAWDDYKSVTIECVDCEILKDSQDSEVSAKVIRAVNQCYRGIITVEELHAALSPEQSNAVEVCQIAIEEGRCGWRTEAGV